MPGTLFRVSLMCALGVLYMLAGVVGVEDVCGCAKCWASNLSVVCANICANLSNACVCLPALLVGLFITAWIAWVRVAAILTGLSIGVSWGTPICCGYNLYWADVLYPPVEGI